MIDNFVNKIKYKLFGYVTKRSSGPKIGKALLSYITSPFTRLPWQKHTDPHSSYWEAQEIARILSKKGYSVDIIDWTNDKFIPKKSYKIFIDINKNLERLSSRLNQDCKKVMHIVSATPQFQNQREQQRLDYLKERSGITLKASRLEENNKNALYADYLEGFGNSTNNASYAYAKKDIFPIPISVSKQFKYINRNYNTSGNKFIWFGGGGAILKGLDIVLEVFSKLPDLELSVIGPIKAEKEFYNKFKHYFECKNIKLFDRPKLIGDNIYVGNIRIEDFVKEYLFMIYPSASEGTSGSVVQSMHLGLIPLITKETGLKEDCPAIILESVKIEDVSKKVTEISRENPERLEEMSKQIWNYANNRHIREKFTEMYSKFLDKILNE